MEKRYLDIKECAEYTGISIKTLYRWSREAKLLNLVIIILRYRRTAS